MINTGSKRETVTEEMTNLVEKFFIHANRWQEDSKRLQGILDHTVVELCLALVGMDRNRFNLLAQE